MVMKKVLLDAHTHTVVSGLAYRLTDAYLQAHFYTSHCTGDMVLMTLQSVMTDQIPAFSCGTMFQDKTLETKGYKIT